MNELCLIFDKLNINTNEVLKAASDEFLNFKPGLVGGHCIGVDHILKISIRKIWISAKNDGQVEKQMMTL